MSGSHEALYSSPGTILISSFEGELKSCPHATLSYCGFRSAAAFKSANINNTLPNKHVFPLYLIPGTLVHPLITSERARLRKLPQALRADTPMSLKAF